MTCTVRVGPAAAVVLLPIADERKSAKQQQRQVNSTATPGDIRKKATLQNYSTRD